LLLRSPLKQDLSDDPYQHTEYIAKVLLKRYGIVFRKILERERQQLPSWRELLYVYRRLEARGDIRGGRFVQGFAGEQYALPEAVALLRKVSKPPHRGESVIINAADPLNLSAIMPQAARVALQAHQRLLYHDGVLVAVGNKKQVTWIESAVSDTATINRHDWSSLQSRSLGLQSS